VGFEEPDGGKIRRMESADSVMPSVTETSAVSAAGSNKPIKFRATDVDF
jgi:hypothetical protein